MRLWKAAIVDINVGGASDVKVASSPKTHLPTKSSYRTRPTAHTSIDVVTFTFGESPRPFTEHCTRAFATSGEQ